jgi:hypothetical protein
VVNSVNTSVADGDGLAVEKDAVYDSSGQLAGYTIRYKVKLGAGLNFDGNGSIVLPGIASCGAGTGLSWDGAKFGCTNAAATYSWNIKSANDDVAGNTNGESVPSGSVIGFFSGNTGLTAARDKGSIIYTLNLAPNGGLTFTNDGISLLQNCGNGQILKWLQVGTSGTWGWQCATDNNTQSYVLSRTFGTPDSTEVPEQYREWTCTDRNSYMVWINDLKSVLRIPTPSKITAVWASNATGQRHELESTTSRGVVDVNFVGGDSPEGGNSARIEVSYPGGSGPSHMPTPCSKGTTGYGDGFYIYVAYYLL